MVNRRSTYVRKRQAANSFGRQFFIGLGLASVLIVVGGIVWFGARLESLTIVDVRVEGGETVDHGEIQRRVATELFGDYYRVIPKRFSWAYPEARIIEAVQGVEKVKEVWLERPDGQSLVIRFTEYAPVALWCEQGVQSRCAFLDDQGYAFTMAPPLVGTALLRYTNAAAPAIGQQPFTAAFMRDTASFAAAVKREVGFSVAEVERIGADEATFTLVGGGLLKITLRQDIARTLDNLKVLLVASEFTHLRPGNFQYIDLRFGDKVFVNEDSGQPDGELSASSSVDRIE